MQVLCGGVREPSREQIRSLCGVAGHVQPIGPTDRIHASATVHRVINDSHT